MILVLGGSGYIGSHTVKRLLADGKEVVVYDDLRLGHREAVEGVPLVEGDIADIPRVRRTLREYRIDAVMHFAAFCYVGVSMEKPLMYYRNNVAGTISLLEAMRLEGVGMIIFSSSAAVYGAPRKTPVTEEEPRHPINPYGCTKAMIEQVMADCGKADGLRYTALRYFNAAGADVDGRLGEWHDPETHLIPLCVYAALGLRGSFTIHGGGYGTPDGSCIRDFVHVDDLADAHVLALERLRAGGASDAFNLGNGAGFSVKEVAAKVREVAGRDFPMTIGPARAGDPPVLVADAALAARELGWKRRYSDLDTIVRTAYDWLKRHPEGYAS